eukprot:4578825-Lingulodinium_polyedra.AAC.1
MWQAPNPRNRGRIVSGAKHARDLITGTGNHFSAKAHHWRRPKTGGRACRTPPGRTRAAGDQQQAQRQPSRHAAGKPAYAQSVQGRHLCVVGSGAVA